MCVYTLTLGGVRCSTGSQKQKRSSAIVIRKRTRPLALAFLSSLHFKGWGCYARVRIPKREERRPPRERNSQKGKFIADSSQGSCRIQRSGVGS